MANILAMEIFNNREVAAIVWGLVALVWLLTRLGIVKQLKALISVICNKYIISAVVLMLLYVSGMVFLLDKIGFWDKSNLKATIYWTFSVAVVSLFRSQKASDNRYYFSTAVKDNLKIIIVFEYLLTFYTFNIWIEIIVFPILFMFGLLLAFSENKKEYEVVRKLSEFILLSYAAILFAYTCYVILSDYNNLATMDTVIDFSLPIVLSILFLPFMYFVVMYISYERAFAMLKLSLDDDIIPYAKKLSLINFHGDRFLLKRWASIVVRSDIKSKQQIKDSINKIKEVVKAEKRPEKVDFEYGWSPHKAKYFLSELGLTTDYYDLTYDDIWYASSDPLCLDGDMAVLTNNIRYSIKGTEKYATTLKLLLDVNKPEESINAHVSFFEFCDVLSERSLGVKLPSQMKEAIYNGEDFSVKLSERPVSIVRHNWVGKFKEYYELIFLISLMEND